MAKMIVGKALKNNKELQDDEIKEIEFYQKYQILSKNTALFADNDNQKNQLIKVNLKVYNNAFLFSKMKINYSFVEINNKNNTKDNSCELNNLNNDKINNYENKNNSINKKIDLMKLIMSQDII